VFVEKVKGLKTKKLEKKKGKDRIENYKEKIINSPKEDLKNILKEIKDDDELSDKRKRKLKTKILSKSDILPEILDELKNDRDPIIKWLAHDYEYSKSEAELGMNLELKSS